MLDVRLARLLVAGSVLGVLGAPACGGRTTLEDEATGGKTSHSLGAGGASVSQGGSSSTPGAGGATAGQGGASGGHGPVVGQGGIGPAVGPGPGAGGAVGGHGPGVGGAAGGQGPGAGGAPAGGHATGAFGGAAGGSSICAQGASCSPPSSCSASDPNQPECSISCQCTAQGIYSCVESCGVGPGPQGFGGGPIGCFPGSACSLGPVCTGPDPMQPQCTIKCACGANGTYDSCGESCGSSCSQGSACQPGTGCSTPGGGDCTITCKCGPDGSYQCGMSCGTGGGPQGVGGGPSTCIGCLGNTLNGPGCAGQLQNCLSTTGCADLLNCAASNGCLDKPQSIECALSSGCQAPGNAFAAADSFVTCGECNGCVGVCPIDPSQCVIADGPIGIGPGGGSGPPPTCGTCSFDYLKQGGCAAEQNQCATTPGCVQLEQCWLNAGCGTSADPISCGQSSCPGSQAANSALVGAFLCAECSGACACNVGCPGTMGVGMGGTGAGGSGAQTCDGCLNSQSQNGACPMEGAVCSQSPDCNAYINCAGQCVDNACAQKCADSFPKGEKLYLDYFWCLACEPVTCQSSCSADYGAFCASPPP